MNKGAMTIGGSNGVGKNEMNGGIRGSSEKPCSFSQIQAF